MWSSGYDIRPTRGGSPVRENSKPHSEFRKQFSFDSPGTLTIPESRTQQAECRCLQPEFRTMNYYDEISKTYDELHKEEQLAKIQIIFDEDLVKPQDKLLDVGCGTGFSLDCFECKEAIGIDPSEKLIQQYKGKHQVQVAQAEQLPFKDSQFDVVLSFTAIQNFDDIQKGLQEIKRVGKTKFGLTFLKRSMKAQIIEEIIEKVFSEFNIKKIEQEKDFIFIIT